MEAPKAMGCGRAFLVNEKVAPDTKDMNAFLRAAGNPMNILWGYKLDGVRTMAVVHAGGYVEYFSRNGKKFLNFKKFDETLFQIAKEMFVEPLNGVYWPVIFDGEMMPKTGNGDSLAKVMTQLRRMKDVDDSNLQFRVFDYIPHAGQNPAQFERYQALVNATNDWDFGDVCVHEHYISPEYFDSPESVAVLLKHAISQGYEGVVLKIANSQYEGRKSGNWIKVKATDTMDLLVYGFVPGEGRHTGRLGALICETPGGIKVQVGSGFSDDERYEFAHATGTLYEGGEHVWIKNLPSMVECGYQEITKTGALRFPTFVGVRNDK